VASTDVAVNFCLLFTNFSQLSLLSAFRFPTVARSDFGAPAEGRRLAESSLSVASPGGLVASDVHWRVQRDTPLRSIARAVSPRG